MNQSRKHFIAFLWHASFLAFTMAFVEVNTVLPSLVLKAGGGSFSIGFITALTTGIPLLGQLFFASILVSKPKKKPYLLLGIYLRTLSLATISFLLSSSLSGMVLLALIFIVLGIFSFSGVFAGICYTDLLGKSIARDVRREFMAFRQIISSGLALVGGLFARYIVQRFEYPTNYSVMFLIAATSLGIASIGFWAIREESVDTTELPGFWEILKSIPKTIKTDANLKNYVLFTNATGFGLIIIPFYVLLAKKSFGLTGENIGNFLLLQMIGMTAAGFFWGYYLNKSGYKKILKWCIFIGALIPILALFLSKTTASLYALVFLFSGITLSARKMSFEGLLIEITNEKNRALYTGTAGALNLVTALLPLLMGSLVNFVGFTIIFTFSSLFILSGTLFLKAIKA
ncbi:MFS transporter [Kosmotoga sp. DU53]|nr:MFS transporter [Kosmotoga sp. DU53]MDK2953936.1 hypothetical protein [Kosmotoga sp.]OAA21425.1 MFS transporter [Kosmotoga sp. DU53]